MGSIPTAPANGSVAQSVRAPACHAGGRGFKSLPSRHFFAVVAQQAEHFLGKEEVDSSNLFNSSMFNPDSV